MSEAVDSRCRLCLITPRDLELADLIKAFAGAVSGGDVASVIITAAADRLQATAEAIVPVAQARGVAALVANDTQVAGRVRADGVHIDTGAADFRTAASLRPKKIVGVGGIRSRHEAMTAGEADPDYLFFGRLDGDTEDGIFDKALELAAWWSSMFVIPAIVMGGRTLASVEQAAAANIEFVALSRAVFDHAEGPAAAVAEANRRLAAARSEP